MLSPRGWPLSVKLAVATLVLALVPLATVMLFDVRDLEVQSMRRETDALRRQATDAALRIGERAERLRAYVEVLAANPTLRAVASSGDVSDADAARAWEHEHPSVFPALESLRRANAWFEHAYVLNENGICVATSERETKPHMFGRDYSFRPYFRAPVESGQPFVSDVLKNATSKGTAIFVSAPIVVDGQTRGVAVIKVGSESLHNVVGELSRLGRRALFIDRFGVVVSDAYDGRISPTESDGSLHFHPLAPVDPSTLEQFRETKRYGDPAGEHYLQRIEDPLGVERLWPLGSESGSLEVELPAAARGAKVPTVVGYAAVWSGEDEPYGHLVVGEASAQFREPLQAIGRTALYRFLVALAVVAVVMGFVIRRLAGDSEADVVAARASAARALERVALEQETKRALLQRLSEAHDVETIELAAAIAGADVELAVTPTRFPVQQVLAEVAGEAKSAAGFGQTKIDVDGSDAGEIETDRSRFGMLLRQLVDNAVANTRKGDISLAARRSGDDIVVTVKDTGMGMSPGQLERAFEGDVTLPSTTASRLGLGVPIARKLAARLGGMLTAASESGKGTTVTLRLPAAG